MEIEEKSRVLFMKYALPCARTLVKRNQVTQEEVDALIELVKKGVVPDGTEKIFKVALAACSLLALDANKRVIDEAVIRKYFLKKHSDMIEKRYEEKGDFDPVACQTRLGSVESVSPGKALVVNSAGKKDYRTDFVDVHEHDRVVTHWDFIVEVIR